MTIDVDRSRLGIRTGPVRHKVDMVEARVAERLAWLLASVRSCGNAYGYLADKDNPAAPPDGFVERFLTLHDGTANGRRITGKGHTTNEAAQDLKAKLLEYAERTLEPS